MLWGTSGAHTLVQLPFHHQMFWWSRTSCLRTLPPSEYLVSLGSPQYSCDLGSCLSYVQTSTVTSVPAPAQQLWNYVCHSPGHHLNPCHLCPFIPCQVSCQYLPHQCLSWHCFSTYFLSCLLLEIGMVKMRLTELVFIPRSLPWKSSTMPICELLQLLSRPSVRQFLMCLTFSWSHCLSEALSALGSLGSWGISVRGMPLLPQPQICTNSLTESKNGFAWKEP